MRQSPGKVKLRLFGDLVRVFQARELEVELERAPNVRGLLRFLANSYERRSKLYDGSGDIRSELNILRNGRNVHFLNGLETELSDGDVISVFPNVFGG